MAETQVSFDFTDQYERFMGRWSRAIGEKFIDWLAAPKNLRWLDAGCGTGSFSELIVRRCAPSSLIGIDPSEAQIDHARTAFPGLDFRVGDAMDMALPDNDFDVVVSALVIHFIRDRAKAFAEMKRVARPDGVIAGYLWKRTATEEYAPYAPFFHGLQHVSGEAARTQVVPEANLDGLRNSLVTAGYREIIVNEIEASQTFVNFDDFWQAQTPSFHPVGKTVAKLSEAKRSELCDYLRASLPIAADGSITYPARAVAFKARK